MAFDEVLNPPPIEIQVNGQGIHGNVDLPNVIPKKYNQNLQDLQARFAIPYFKQVLLKIYYKNHKTISFLGNVLVIIIITLIMSKVLKAMCPSADDSVELPVGDRIYCDQYAPVDRVVVDVDMNATAHCYSSKSCVALAESLWESQGKLRYNFIVGSRGFVYVGNGFKCRSEESENALYVRLAVLSVGNGYSFVTARSALEQFRKILAEGVECSRILHNYTITTTGCGRSENWCTDYLSAMFPQRDDIRAHDYFHDGTRSAAWFNPFSIDRVYNSKSYLVECQTHSGIKH